MSKQTSNTTLAVGMLRVIVKAAGLGGETLDTATATEFEVDVEYSYVPGVPASGLSGPFEDADPGCAAECEVAKVKTTASLHFEGDFSSVTINRGTDISGLFSGSEIYQMADRILDSIEKSK